MKQGTEGTILQAIAVIEDRLTKLEASVKEIRDKLGM
jgi:hypothetical protein